MSLPARHELLMPTGWRDAECACGLWFGTSTNHDQMHEDYQTHRDVIDEAARFESQRLDNAAARAVNLGAK